jgi:hypothetical protein
VKATGIFVTPVMPTSLKKQRWRRPSWVPCGRQMAPKYRTISPLWVSMFNCHAFSFCRWLIILRYIDSYFHAPFWYPKTIRKNLTAIRRHLNIRVPSRSLYNPLDPEHSKYVKNWGWILVCAMFGQWGREAYVP